MSEAPVVDPAVLARLYKDIGSDAEVMRELVDTFLDQGPKLVAEARAAAAASDWRTLNRAAHTLKSSALTFGAAKLGAVCRALEEDAMKGPVPAAVTRATEMGTEWARAADAVKSWSIPI